MTLITSENAPILQRLFNEVAKDKPCIGRVVRVTRGKHAKKVGIVEKHIRSRFENPYRYGSEMSHHMIDARGRYGFAILVHPEDGTPFWTAADNVMVCCPETLN